MAIEEDMKQVTAVIDEANEKLETELDWALEHEDARDTNRLKASAAVAGDAIQARMAELAKQFDESGGEG